MAYCKTFEFSAAVRGYHYYRRYWTPQQDQELICSHEPDNPFDQFAIKVCDREKEDVVGHLPREISRATKIFIDRVAKITATLTSTHYRRSPLVQGGMEIPCKISASIPGTCQNLLLLERYKQLIKESYTEPENEEILGSFINVEGSKEYQNHEPKSRRKIEQKKLKTVEVKTKDIRGFFLPEENRNETFFRRPIVEENNESEIID